MRGVDSGGGTGSVSVEGVAHPSHTFIPTPDGRYGLGMSEPIYRNSPIRLIDLQLPGPMLFGGEVEQRS